jgi:tetratricopeptide (TPR) repeat protein
MTPMSADRFLDRLEKTGLLEAWFLQTLREQTAASKTPVTADAIAKRLVRSGHLTKLQASKLLSDAEEDAGDRREPAGRAAAGPPKPAQGRSEPKRAPSIDEELGLAPLDDESDLGLAPLPEDASANPPEEEVVMLEDASGKAAKASRAVRQPPRPEPAGLTPLEPVAGLQPLDAVGGLEPLDGSGLQELEQQELAEGGLAPPSEALRKGRRVGRKPQAGSPWDSSLMYAGGGGLLLLLIVGVVLWYLLTRVSAAELLQAADEAYRSGSYIQAIPNYERFLAKYPDDPNVSLARVRIGTAQIRQVLEGSKDKQPALKAAEGILPTIENEAAFDEARAELASILPEIAEGFSQPAKVEPDMQKAQALVDLAEQALQLVNNPAYIPTSLRRPVETRIENIQEDLELSRRNINQSKRLREVVEAIRQATQAGKTAEAYEVRRRLLGQWLGVGQRFIPHTPTPFQLAGRSLQSEDRSAGQEVYHLPIVAGLAVPATAGQRHPEFGCRRAVLPDGGKRIFNELDQFPLPLGDRQHGFNQLRILVQAGILAQQPAADPDRRALCRAGHQGQSDSGCDPKRANPGHRWRDGERNSPR